MTVFEGHSTTISHLRKGVIMRSICRSGLALAIGLGLGFLLAQWWHTPGQISAQEKPKAASPEQRVVELKLTLPKAGKPVATYVSAVRVGNLLFLAGQGPAKPGGGFWSGRLG